MCQLRVYVQHINKASFYSKIKITFIITSCIKTQTTFTKIILIEKYLNTCGICRNTVLLLCLQLKRQRNSISHHQNIQYLPQPIFGKKFVAFSEQTKASAREAGPRAGRARSRVVIRTERAHSQGALGPPVPPSLDTGGNQGRAMERRPPTPAPPLQHSLRHP